MMIRDLSQPTLFHIIVKNGIMTATHGNITIECDVPGHLIDWIGPGCFAMCTIAEGLLVIHERVG